MKILYSSAATVAMFGLLAAGPVAQAQTMSGGSPAGYLGAPVTPQNGSIAALQQQVQALTNRVDQLENTNASARATPYTVSDKPLPNYDNSPIPNGDYSPGWTG